MNPRFRDPRRSRTAALLSGLLLPAAFAASCGGGGGAGGPGGGPGGAGGPGGGPPALPVPVLTVAETQLRDSTEYVATLRSRHTSNVQPQVEGVITRIFVKSGDRVAAGAPLMQIDPLKQQAAVRSEEATRQLKRAALDYARKQVQRMETLFKGGAASKQQLDEAQSALGQAQADYDALGAQVQEQKVQLAYYRVAAPAAGVVGDIPVRTGDRVTTSTLLTTIDQNDALEVYISVPLEHAGDLRPGLPVEVLGGNGEPLARTQVSFISPQVDDQTQEVLVKAPVPNGQRGLRAAQFVRARIVWRTHPGIVAPVLAVSRINGQYFVFAAEPAPAGKPAGAGAAPGGAGGAGEKGGGPGGGSGGAGGPGGPGGGGPSLVARQRPISVGDVVGNDYVVLAGLRPGDRIVASGVQKLADGSPIKALPAAPAGGPGAATPTGSPGGAGGPGSAGGSGGSGGTGGPGGSGSSGGSGAPAASGPQGGA